MRISLIAVLSIFALNLPATIINIPADQLTIQEGINVAVNGDTVLVQPGIYFENINYNGKLITIASLMLTTQNPSYISQTVIDGNQNGSVVIFENEENSEAILCGFTITNGYAQGNSNYEDCGGGIFCDYYTTPQINDVVITDNIAISRGGGLYCNELYGGAILNNVTICNNSAELGGGIANGFGYPSSVNLSNVSIRNNTATYGGGIYWEGTDLNFNSSNRCNIYSNSSDNLGKEIYVHCVYSSAIEVIVDTFSVLIPTEIHSYPIENFSFNILNSIENNSINNEVILNPVVSLNQNFPNPFNPSTTIEFSIQNDSRVNLSIFNIKGQKIKTLVNNEFSKGFHTILWNGDDEFEKVVSSGIYYYKLNVNGKTEAEKKCLLLK